MTDLSTLRLSPLILTLAIDADNHSYFNALRKQHFPAEINYLDSHLTLFHNLPPDQPGAMTATVDLIESFPAFTLEVIGLMNLGKGVAFKIASSQLADLHVRLQNIWKPWLTRQDMQTLRPHITVQNKVDPAEARQLLQSLSKDFVPFTCKASGVDSFEYMNGPWKFKFHTPFMQS